MSGVCAFAALHHGLAVMQRRRGNRIHLLFALLSVLIMAMILAKAGAYQAQTAQALVVLRKWEVSAICLFFVLFPWFIAEFTGVRPRKLLHWPERLLGPDLCRQSGLALWRPV